MSETPNLRLLTIDIDSPEFHQLLAPLSLTPAQETSLISILKHCSIEAPPQLARIVAAHLIPPKNYSSTRDIQDVSAGLADLSLSSSNDGNIGGGIHQPSKQARRTLVTLAYGSGSREDGKFYFLSEVEGSERTPAHEVELLEYIERYAPGQNATGENLVFDFAPTKSLKKTLKKLPFRLCEGSQDFGEDFETWGKYSPHV